jgi:hypothetical protein
MKILPKVLLAGAMLFASAGLLYDAFGNGSASAETIDYSRDCDKYAVMYCGSMTKEEILQKLNNGDGRNSASNIQSIFSQFGLNASSIQNASFQNGVVYQNGEVKIGTKVVATNSQTYIRELGGKVSTSKMGSAQAALVAMDSNGKFMFAVMTPCGNPVTGTPVEPPKPPEPKPQSITCDALKVDILNNKTREVDTKVTGTANNTTITGYKIDFGDGTVVNQQTAKHTYKDYGKFVIKAHVSGMVNGKTVTVGGDGGCVVTKEFVEPPKPQVQALKCEDLKLDIFNKDKKFVQVTAIGSAQNTTIDKYTIDFDDGTVVNEKTAEHTYADYGTYKIVATVTGMVDGKEVSNTNSNCEQTVDFKKPEEPPVTPPAPELPKTGAGALLGLFSGVSILGAVGHRLWTIKRMQ